MISFENSFLIVSYLIAETKTLDHFAVPDQCPVALLPGISAKTISSIDCELDQITVKMFVFRSQIGWFRIALPFNLRARCINQLCLKPFCHDLFVVGRIRSVTCRVCRFCFRIQIKSSTDSDKRCTNPERNHFHISIHCVIFPAEPNDVSQKQSAGDAFLLTPVCLLTSR